MGSNADIEYAASWHETCDMRHVMAASCILF